MTPLNISSKKLVLLVLVLSLFTALVSAGCDTGTSGSTATTPTAIVNPNTGGSSNATAGTDNSNVPAAVPTTAGSGSSNDNATAPTGVGTVVPTIGTPPANATGTPNSNTNTN